MNGDAPVAAEGAAFAKEPHWLLRSPTHDLRYRVYCRAFALASASRLTLPDALTEGFLGPALLHGTGALLLAWNGAPLGWLLAALGGALPLLFLQDQLSQSLYLCLCACVAVSCSLGSGGAPGRGQRLSEQLPLAVRGFSVLVYGFAVVHKLNAGYLDPTVGCANEGLRVLFEQARFDLPLEARGWLDSPLWPIAHLCVEATIPCLLVYRPVAGVLLAALMHAPLTVIFAPSFAFTMMSGWVCFFSSEQLLRFFQAVRRRAVAIALLGAGLSTLSRSLWFVGRGSEDPEWVLKEVLFWVVLAAVWLTLPSALGFGAPRATGPRRTSLCVKVFLVGYGLNALTPYLGLQFHHTAAMLSNLRIDAGCWNSLVFPEWLRLSDPYVRLSRLEFAPGRATPGARDAFRDRLWEPGALFEARARWCRTHPEPLPVAGSYRGVRFERSDLCAPEGWPLDEPVLPGFRRFQVNLTRTCQKRCLH